MRYQLGDGWLYVPPRCPECKTDRPNEIEDAQHRGLDSLVLQCRSCGHLWDRTKIRATNVTVEMTWASHEPAKPKQLPDAD